MSTLPDPTNAGNKPGDGPLRAGGQLGASPSTENNQPSTPSKAVAAQAPDLEMVRCIWGGTTTIRAAGTKYLPQSPGEEAANYADRLQRSVFHNFFRRTVEGLVGMVFARDPVLGKDVPKRIADHWENIDNAGTHGDVFAREVFQDDLIAGHAAILVEYPAVRPDAQADGTANALEAKGVLRPYWVLLKKDQIKSWRTTTENGHQILTQVVIEERAMVPEGLFGEREQVRYRVFYREAGVVGFVLLEVTPSKAVVRIEKGTYPTQDEIPIAEIVSSGRTGLFESAPPLLDLACLNVAHYQQWSDYATNLHMTLPVYAEFGVDAAGDIVGHVVEPIVLGPYTARRFTNPQARIEYVSHSGASLAAAKDAMDDLKSDMGSLGLAMLAPQKRAAETAEAKRLDKSASDSALSVAARGLQDGLERALIFHARYLGGRDGGSIQINRDFEQQAIGSDVVQAYAVLVERLGLPPRVAVKALKNGGWIAEDEDEETLAEEMLGGLAAIQQQREERTADLLAGIA